MSAREMVCDYQSVQNKTRETPRSVSPREIFGKMLINCISIDVKQSVLAYNVSTIIVTWCKMDPTPLSEPHCYRIPTGKNTAGVSCTHGPWV